MLFASKIMPVKERLAKKAIRDEKKRLKLGGDFTVRESQSRLNIEALNDYCITSRTKAMLYSSEEWATLKKWAFNRYEYKCSRCMSKSSLNLDHIYPITTHPEKCLDFTNLQYLCRKCNFEKSNTSHARFKKLLNPFRLKEFMPHSDDIYRIRVCWVKYFPRR
jgi:5-methylcytosine-specific restriction endonuclease McrA